ncbi:ENDD1 protein, partial [Amia calva]|nr:ENDD1 protein [Amia calva]
MGDTKQASGWTHICVSWKSSSGMLQLWVDGRGSEVPKESVQEEANLHIDAFLLGKDAQNRRTGPVDQNVVQSQAIELDYINSSYTRGHLSPSLHHSDDIDKCATFTLTNIVPQKGPSNDGPWAAFEKDIKNRLTSYCAKEAYIVTGVIPYQKDRWIKGDRVAIPEYLWSAYCCPSYNTSIPANLTQAFPTYAAIGRNDPNSTEEIVPVDKTRPKKYLGYDVRLMSLKTLEMYLQDRLGTVFSVFYNGCST